ncbi:M48 metallopeptidase family protein [Brachybacterium hainanense]|uniref:M48 family metallopeptidase n=1 Tax=Brachybacterium hainanense TaxID=1541174 RepID=A0ABV6RFG9_9MICO
MPRTTAQTCLSERTGPRGERVLVRRSARRRRSVSITRRDGDLVVAIPASFSRREEREWVDRMLERLGRSEAARTSRGSTDQDLQHLAQELSVAHFEGRAHPAAVTWSTRQNRRWGSCTPSERTIRLSHRLQGMPSYVVEAVLVHELAHLFVPGHGPDFQALTRRYPRMERAMGFLDGVSHAQSWDLGLEDDVPEAAQA